MISPETQKASRLGRSGGGPVFTSASRRRGPWFDSSYLQLF